MKGQSGNRPILRSCTKSRRKGGREQSRRGRAPTRAASIRAKGMKATVTRIVGPEAGARKYDLLTGLATAALQREAHAAAACGDGPASDFSAVTALRLIALITARYDWARDSAAIGHSDLERLWGVSRRTVIREIDRLRRLGLLELVSEGRRGRVSVYRLGQARIADLTRRSWSGAGDKFAQRMASLDPPVDMPPGPARCSAVVALFPGGDAAGQGGWRRIVAALGEDISVAALRRWIQPLICRRLDDTRLDLAAPSRFHADYVVRTYGAALERAAHRSGLPGADVRVTAC